jgi:signal transduction histidine kinase
VSPPTPSADDRQRARPPRLLRLPRHTLRLRLTLLYGGVFLVSGAVLLAITFLLVGQTTSAPTYTVKGTAVGPVVSGPHGTVAVSVFETRLAHPGGHGSTSATGMIVSRANGISSGASGASKRAPSSIVPAAREGAARATGGVRVDGRGKEVATLVAPRGKGKRPLGVPITPEQAQQQARKLEALGRQQHTEERHQLLVDLGIALAIMAIVSMGLGWFVAGRALRPLQTITRAARAISATSLHRRLALRGPRDELHELGDTFDELLERLERSFEAQRQFVANASHELRTPLTLERAIVEVTLADPLASNETLRATCERVLALGEQQERMIDALLALARSERGLARRDPFDLAAVTRDVIVARRPDIARRGLDLESKLEEAPTSGDPSLAERLVANLIDNAIRHNHAGGWVSVTTTIEDGRAVLSVSNSGPLVPAEEIERLFRPFERLGAARSSYGGHGLGLSIVQAVATAHGASLRAQARAEGGIEIEVSFAAAAAGDLDRPAGPGAEVAGPPAVAVATGARGAR